MSNPTCNIDSMLAGCSQLVNLSQKQLQAEVIYLMAVQLAAVGGTDYTHFITTQLVSDATAALGLLDTSKLPSCEVVIRYNQAVGMGLLVPDFANRQSNLGCLLTLSDQDLLRIKTLLLCQLGVGTASDGRSGGVVIITPPSDPDAAKFVCGWLNICSLVTGSCTSINNCPPETPIPIASTCASFCQITQKIVDAIGALTDQLKAAGLWDLLDIIYPFVGGSSGPCSLNLKDTSKFQITWHGGTSFAQGSALSDGTGYGDTGWIPSVNGVNFTLNSACIGAYLKNPTSTVAYGYVGGSSSGAALDGAWIQVNPSTGAFTARINDAGATVTAISSINTGNVIASRTASNLKTIYTPDGTTGTDADAPSFLNNSSFYVLGYNQGGALNIPLSGVSFFYAGAGLDSTKVAALSSIVTTFVNSK